VAVADHRPDRWAAHLPVTQLRFARPTSRLEAVVHFYRDCLGLDELSPFEDHAGYDGVILGLPDASYHLELTQRTGIDGTATTKENLLVLDLRTASALALVVARFTNSGYQPVQSQDPFWAAQDAVTFEDPDGWHVILVPGPRR
jgi:catechol 2,3-dioxygenase-like lactoylglutathione lyase family enzyme